MQTLKEHYEDTSFDIFIAVKFRIPALCVVAQRSSAYRPTSNFIFMILILV